MMLRADQLLNRAGPLREGSTDDVLNLQLVYDHPAVCEQRPIGCVLGVESGNQWRLGRPVPVGDQEQAPIPYRWDRHREQSAVDLSIMCTVGRLGTLAAVRAADR